MNFIRYILMRAHAFSPGHITGFFQICDEPENPLLKGSRGAGVSVSRGVTTTVDATPSKRSSINVRINGQPTSSAPVSKGVANRFLKLLPNENFEIQISHKVALPIGCGFGTSGAAALSLSLALNHVFSLGLTQLEAAQIAHIVEVEQKTGLGTVIAEMTGGIEIRTVAGGPGIGEVEVIPASKDYMVVCLPFGPISTPKYLRDDKARKRINERGGFFTDNLRGNPTVTNFLKCSRQFAEHVHLITERVHAVLQDSDAKGFTCSTAIFGENAFTLVLPSQVQEITAILESHKSMNHDVLVMNVDTKGACLINE